MEGAPGLLSVRRCCFRLPLLLPLLLLDFFFLPLPCWRCGDVSFCLLPAEPRDEAKSCHCPCLFDTISAVGAGASESPDVGMGAALSQKLKSTVC